MSIKNVFSRKKAKNRERQVEETMRKKRPTEKLRARVQSGYIELNHMLDEIDEIKDSEKSSNG